MGDKNGNAGGIVGFGYILATYNVSSSVSMERVKGIEPSSRFTFFKAFICSEMRYCQAIVLELFILTFILTSLWQASSHAKSPASIPPASPAETAGN
jgi:hypothetical protein